MKLYAILESVLKSESNNTIITKLIDNQGDLMGNKIHDLVDKTDENLIGLLLENQELREKFFFKIKDVYVFKTNDFKFFLDENKIDNSYTQYENRIGLTAGGKFLKDSADVVLDFPYKDCILEGGQSTEEGTDTYFEYDQKDGHYLEKQAKRKEIFFNTVLAKDEIDRLLEPKAFNNIKKYTANGKENITSFERDENGTIKDNLIIKGNNLLALHTLKSEFAGKVKLIYIDPPYNTGNDSFAYNDNFNHSTWLTFMRNRLLIAKELLREDGFVFIHCDYNEDSYLKVLMDEVFKRDLYVTTITVKSNSISGNKTQHKDKTILKNKDSIIVFKSKQQTILNPQYSVKTEWDTHYNSILIKDSTEIYSIKSLKDVLVENGVINKGYTINNNSINETDFYSFIFKNKECIFRGVNSIPKDLKIMSLENKDKVVFIDKDNEKMFAFNGNRLSFLSKVFKLIDGKQKMSQLLGDLWIDIDFQNTQNEGGDVSLTNGKKPEALLRRIIDMTTSENDIVLDYHLGSGTTAVVAHKMKRQYLGIEQLDYGKNDSVVRLQNVINNDQSGISKSVNWKGGGLFVYLELAKNNQNAIEYIQSCESYHDLVDYFDEMCNKYFLHYNVKVKEFREVICKEENFEKLTLDQQKIMFVKMLDLNQLYVNVSDMEDSRYALSATDIAVTKDFYQL